MTKQVDYLYKSLPVGAVPSHNPPFSLRSRTAFKGMANPSNPYSYHLFALPAPLLETLTPRNDVSSRDLIQQPQPAADGDDTVKIGEPSSRDPATASASTTSGRSCNVCQGTSFANVDDQRSHFRSDWHRYNVKLRLNGKDPVVENKFAQLLEGVFGMLQGNTRG
jgi:hypothetical protein